jgi:hypothetical protein
MKSLIRAFEAGRDNGFAAVSPPQPAAKAPSPVVEVKLSAEQKKVLIEKGREIGQQLANGEILDFDPDYLVMGYLKLSSQDLPVYREGINALNLGKRQANRSPSTSSASMSSAPKSQGKASATQRGRKRAPSEDSESDSEPGIPDSQAPQNVRPRRKAALQAEVRVRQQLQDDEQEIGNE